MSIKKNLILNMFYQVLNIVIPFITAPYLARTIGVEGTGIYAYYNSIAYYFILFIMLGLNNYGNRTIARVKNNKEKLSEVFCNIYALQVIMGGIGLGIYIIYVLTGANEYKLIACLNIIYVLSAVFDISWFFSGLEKFKIIVARNSIVKLITLILIFIFIKNIEDVWIYVLITAISSLLSQLSTWTFLPREIDWVKPTWKLIKRHVKPNIILFLPVVAVSLYKIMDKIMIGVLNSKIQVGFYENSEKIINIPQALINSLGTVMLPRISNILMNGQNGLSRRYLRDSMQYAMGLSIAVAFGLIGISENFVFWFLGEDFAQCAIIVAFLAPTIIFNAWANVIRTQYLLPLNKDTNYLISVSTGAIVNLFINFMLIKKWGAVGASIGTIAAEFVVMLIQTACVFKELNVIVYIKDSLGFILSGIVMCYVVLSIGQININGFAMLIIQLFVGASLYLFLSAIIIRIMDKDRFLYIVENLKIKKN